jgi:CheY-like chemotaxis protein
VLVMLDLKMPKVDGLDVLRAIKTHPVLKRMPVVVLTSARAERRGQELRAGRQCLCGEAGRVREVREAVKQLGSSGSC